MLNTLSLRLCCAVLLFVACLLPARADEFSVVAPGVEAAPGPLQSLEPGSHAFYIRLSADALLTARPPRVWLDGVDISNGCTRSGDTITCPLPANFPQGLHRVRLELARLLGSASEVSWQFAYGRVLAPERRDGTVIINHNAVKHTLYEGDILEVTMSGPPRGKASVWASDRFIVPMTESAEGIYTGTHEVERADFVVGARLSGRLDLPDGRVFRGDSESPVKIFGSMFTVRILSPKPGDKVGWDFVIEGRTRPGAVVSISPNLGTRAPTAGGQPPSPGHVTRDMGAIEVTADQHGAFKQKFGFPIHLFDVKYTFTVNAVDKEGNNAIPGSFSVTIGEKKSDEKKSEEKK